MSNLIKVLSSNSKKCVKIYIYNILAHPVNKNQNNLKVVTIKVIGICKMVNVSHDPLSIESSQKTIPTIQKHSLNVFLRYLNQFFLTLCFFGIKMGKFQLETVSTRTLAHVNAMVEQITVMWFGAPCILLVK